MAKGKEFRILFVSEKSGKRFSGKVTFFTLMMMVLFIVCLAGTTAFSLSRYFSMAGQNRTFPGKIAHLEQEINEREMEKSEGDAYRQWAEKIIFKRLNYESAAAQGNSVLSTNTLQGDIRDNSRPHFRSPLNIDDLDIVRINLALDFNISFKLTNRAQDKKTGGYLFIMASNTETVPEIYECYPRTDIVSGLPKDYTKGVTFNIRYLKKIKGRINQPDIGPRFNRIDVLAYAENGDLIMKKGFYIEKNLQESPFE